MSAVDFHIIIPARYESTRLPGKLMMEIKGITVIERVYQQALKANPRSIIIATDSAVIAEHVAAFGAEVMLTAEHHQSGTDRIAEVVQKKGYASDEVIINVQGDEPFIEPALIQQLAKILHSHEVPMATLCWPIENQEQFFNSNVVKVVRDELNHALYFSRSPIPAYRDQYSTFTHAYRHIGLYAYRAAFLLQIVNWPPCELEKYEALEQLRILWKGYKIQVEEACCLPLQDINTVEDLQLARQLADR